MRSFYSVKTLIAFLAIFLAIGSTEAFAQKKKPVLKRKSVARKKVTPAKPTVPVFAVESGRTMRVRMNSTISSKTAKAGQTFTVTVTEPVYSSTGVVVIPTGSTILGRVDTVTPAAKGGKVGSIDATFIQINLPNGRKRAINGSLAELDSSSAKSDNEGTAAGDKTRYRKAIFIGGGGVGGAVLGGAVGGGKGALIGGIIGGVGGFIAETQTKGEEATVRTGTEFGVRLNQSISLPRFVESTP